RGGRGTGRGRGAGAGTGGGVAPPGLAAPGREAPPPGPGGDAAQPVRPVDLGTGAHRAAVRVPLPDRDLRAGTAPGARLLRPPVPAGGPAGRPGGSEGRPGRGGAAGPSGLGGGRGGGREG